MKIYLPGGISKNIKPTSCNVTDNNGNITCNITLDIPLTANEKITIVNAIQERLGCLQTPCDHTDEIQENELFLNSLNP